MLCNISHDTKNQMFKWELMLLKSYEKQGFQVHILSGHGKISAFKNTKYLEGDKNIIYGRCNDYDE